MPAYQTLQRSNGGKNQESQQKISTDSIAIFTSYASIFFAQVFRCPPDHQAGDKYRQNHKHDDSIESCTHAAKTTSPSMMLISGTMPPSGVNESCIAVYGTTAGIAS